MCKKILMGIYVLWVQIEKKCWKNVVRQSRRVKACCLGWALPAVSMWVQERGLQDDGCPSWSVSCRFGCLCSSRCDFLSLDGGSYWVLVLRRRQGREDRLLLPWPQNKRTPKPRNSEAFSSPAVWGAPPHSDPATPPLTCISWPACRWPRLCLCLCGLRGAPRSRSCPGWAHWGGCSHWSCLKREEERPLVGRTGRWTEQGQVWLG